jgi:hypothetical protein
MDLTFEFPFRGDRESVQAELRSRGFKTRRPLARVGDEALLEVSDVADQQQVFEVEALVRRVSRASRRLGGAAGAAVEDYEPDHDYRQEEGGEA